MKLIITRAVGIFILMLLVQVSSLAMPATPMVTWADSNGSHSVFLTLASNPEYTGDPLGIEKMLSWQGDLNVVMTDNNNPIAFTCSGYFNGPSDPNNPSESIWYQVRLNQHVLNNTSMAWNEFDLGLSPLGSNQVLDRGVPTFYNFNAWTPVEWSAWNPDNDPTKQSYYADETGPFVNVGESFFDVAKIYAGIDLTTGYGGFILTKTAVPEPGSIMALSCGLIGFISLARRRKN